MTPPEDRFMDHSIGATPWGMKPFYVTDASGRPLLTFYYALSEAEARTCMAATVLAVNHHDDLVEAVTRTLKDAEHHHDCKTHFVRHDFSTPEGRAKFRATCDCYLSVCREVLDHVETDEAEAMRAEPSPALAFAPPTVTKVDADSGIEFGS